jgi:hypothetical protein
VRLAGCFVLAVLHTWPLASAPGSLSRLDNADTALNMWIVSWVAHALFKYPLAVFQAPMFHPEALTLAYSENLIVPAIIGAPMLWMGASPVLAYNLLAIVGLALSAWAMLLVVESWTGSTAAGVVSGMLFAFNAHLLTRFVHLQALHVEFLPLALWAFDRVLRRGQSRDAALLSIAFVLQALCSNYTMVFLAAALLVAALVRWREWAAASTRSTLGRLGLAAAASAVLLLPVLWPYYAVSRDQGLVRSIDEVARYSAGWQDYLTTGGRLHYAWWSHQFFEGRTALFPGIAATLLAVGALASSAVRTDARVRMTVAFGVLGLALSFGPALPGYASLHERVPLLQGLRGAARWGFLALVAVAMLAGYGVAAIDRRLQRSAMRAAAIVAIAGLVTVEALRAPMGFVPFGGISRLYRQIAADPRAVVVELPIYFGDRVARNAAAVVGNTQYLRPMVNGYSGFQPASFVERAARLRAFPDPSAMAELRQLGVTDIVVRVEEFIDTEGRERFRAVDDSPDLALVDERDGLRRYRLR